MDAFTEWLAIVSLLIVLIVVIVVMRQSWREGQCGLGGWGCFRRDTHPAMYWGFMGFHGALAVVIAAGLGLKLWA
jgi:hypothetical protein